jgi:hypothetical protein
MKEYTTSAISGFRSYVDKICILLGYYTSPLNMGQILCPETSVKDYHSTQRYILEKRIPQCITCISEYSKFRGLKYPGYYNGCSRTLPQPRLDIKVNYLSNIS